MLCTSHCSAIQNRNVVGLKSSLPKTRTRPSFHKQSSRMYLRPSPLVRPFMNPLTAYGKFTRLAPNAGGSGKLGSLSVALWSGLMTLTIFDSAPHSVAAAAHQIVSAFESHSRFPICPATGDKC